MAVEMAQASHRRILITGASGFVGNALVSKFAKDSWRELILVTRRRLECLPPHATNLIVHDISGDTSWREALDGVDLVIHCASRVHVMKEIVADPLAEFRRVNVDGTLALAQQSAKAGVRRLIFLSSVKVNGESTMPNSRFDADQLPNPGDAYGISKLEAERALMDVATKTGMEFVVVRPPLVYGPGVKANFRTMMKWVYRGYPMPFGAVDNRRSLVGIDNLVSLIDACIEKDSAANQVFLASDGDDISTARLLREVGVALGRPARLIPVPTALLRVCGSGFGGKGVMERLCGNLQVDIEKNKRLLAWIPPVPLSAGLQSTAQSFLNSL